MPDRLLRSVRLRWAAMIFGGYWLLALTVGLAFDWTLVTVILLFVMTFVAAGVIVKYGPMVWRSTLANDRGPVSQLSTGILIGFTALFLLLTATAVSGLIPSVAFILNDTRVHGFVMLLYIMAGTVHMTARRDDRGRLRREDVIAVVACYLIGLASVGTIMLAQAFGLIAP